MNENSHPINKIHHINASFNSRFSGALYYCGALVTFLLIIFPYALRTALAFFVNIFFNRPRIYIDFIRVISRRFNIIPIFILYFAVMGIYGIFFRLSSVFRLILFWRQKKRETCWISSSLKINPEWYRRQS